MSRRQTLRQEAHTLARLQYECDLVRLDHADDHEYVREMEQTVEKFKDEHPAAILWMYGTAAERERIESDTCSGLTRWLQDLERPA